VTCSAGGSRSSRAWASPTTSLIPCSARLDKPPEEDPQAAVGEFVGVFTNPRLTWEDLEFLRSRTTLPIALKGILHPDDARAAREHGMDAIVVSNHGGRQIDGSIASLDALPAIVDAVGGELELLLDSGVRSGADAVKALALGADAVLIGRPYVWGLAAGGEAGVLAVLRGMLAELDLTIGLSGYTEPGQLHAGMLVRGGAA
jgi:isopentenyl diphosphate isomerase/L-lactate dehydrogenase-like FMN-dependent dehydrogenase